MNSSHRRRRRRRQAASWAGSHASQARWMTARRICWAALAALPSGAAAAPAPDADRLLRRVGGSSCGRMRRPQLRRQRRGGRHWTSGRSKRRCHDRRRPRASAGGGRPRRSDARGSSPGVAATPHLGRSSAGLHRGRCRVLRRRRSSDQRLQRRWPSLRSSSA